MALRKPRNKDVGEVPPGDQQEDEAFDDGDDNEELSSSLLAALSTREKRRREKGNKSRPKEMTEEEMMDLALRLSEQEASVAAIRLQKEEEEAMMKAIEESMISQTQPCPPSQSQSLLTDAGASPRICPRRKLLYSNGKPTSSIDQGASEDSCTPGTDQNQGAKRSGDESKRNKKRKRKEGSPLREMPNLSQTQKIYSQASPSSSEVLDVALGSPQSSDSTQIDDCQLCKSPVFPSTGCRAEVHVPRLSQDVLQTCRTSGFVWCSQDSLTSPLKSLPAQSKSPTFSKSPKHCSDLASCKSPVFSETDQGDNEETEASPEYCRSPVFGRNTQHEKSLIPCKLQVNVCNSGFMVSSQESLTTSLRSTSCRPQSPVFPRSPGPSKNHPPQERSTTCDHPVSSETGGGHTEQSHGHCTSPVFDRTGCPQKICPDMQNPSASASAVKLKGPKREEDSTAPEGPSQSLRQDSQTGDTEDVRLNESSSSDHAEEEPKETSKDQDSDEMELTSNMTLVWSDDDDNATPVGTPSPVFPEERPVLQADGRTASQNNVATASPGPTHSICRPSSSSTAADRQQRSTTEQESINTEGEPAGGSTVHYYWGVPFCPRGLDPDSYTQVILAQMEVYEKSLKQAQRCLLRKAEWGEAILPQTEESPPSPEPASKSPQELFPLRSGLRLRNKRLSEAAGAHPTEAEEEEDNNTNGDEMDRGSKGGEGEEQMDTDDCEVCPETQLSDNDDDRTQDLMRVTDTKAEVFPQLLSNGPELPKVEMILQVDSPAADELQEEEEEIEVDAPVDRSAEGDIPGRYSQLGGQHVSEKKVEEDRADPDVEETKDRGPQRSTSPELEKAIRPQIHETSVDCPICQGSFPVTEIEMHAAYCDGEVAFSSKRRPKTDSFQVSLKPRTKRTRRVEVTGDETSDSCSTARNQEKCFICQTVVPLRDYGRHTELCIQRQESKSTAKENLLSALEKTESRDPDTRPSGSKVYSGEVIDLLNDDDEEEGGGASAIRISNSPIRSFTPISEATDSLIDFRKPHRSKKPSQRRR